MANTRIHGTTRPQVGKVFQEVARSKLLPLPASLFPVDCTSGMPGSIQAMPAKPEEFEVVQDDRADLPRTLYQPSGFSTPWHISLFSDHFSRTATGPTAYTKGSMSQNLSDPDKIKIAGGIEYIYWLTLLGKSRSTGWRWRRAGPKGEAPRVRCCRIDNTLYISHQEIRRFWRRAEAGEFEGHLGGICAPKAA